MLQMACLKRLAYIISAVILITTVIRMFVVCLSSPMTGYANNLDFMRQSACVGAWENYLDRSKRSANFERPVNDLVFDGDRIRGLCLHSADNLFVWILLRLYHKGAHLQLRYVGALKVVVAAALMTFTVLQRKSALLQLVICTAFYLTFGDIAEETYFNTLYVDASGIITVGFLIPQGAVLAACCRPPGWMSFTVNAIVLLWLGTVKSQYGILAILLGVFFAICLVVRWSQRLKAILLLVVAVAGPLLFFGLNSGSTRIAATANRVNLADALLGAVLPAAENPYKALKILGLPGSCEHAIGSNGYTPAIRERALCPQISDVSRLRLLPLVIVQPSTLWRPLQLAVEESRPSYLSLNKFEHSGDAELLWFRLDRATSLSYWLALAPIRLYKAIVITTCLTSIFGVLIGFVLLLAAKWRAAVMLSGELTLLLLGSLVAFYALLSAVYGDGLIEVARHTACMPIGLAFAAAGSFGLLARALTVASARIGKIGKSSRGVLPRRMA